MVGGGATYHFSFADTTLEDGYAYYVRVIQSPDLVFPVTMQDYYDDAITWFVHLD